MISFVIGFTFYLDEREVIMDAHKIMDFDDELSARSWVEKYNRSPTRLAECFYLGEMQ